MHFKWLISILVAICHQIARRKKRHGHEIEAWFKQVFILGTKVKIWERGLLLGQEMCELCMNLICMSLYLGLGLSKLLKFGKSGGSAENSGVVLLSNRSLNKDHVTSGEEGGITLISKRPLDMSTESLDGKFYSFPCRKRERERRLFSIFFFKEMFCEYSIVLCDLVSCECSNIHVLYLVFLAG